MTQHTAILTNPVGGYTNKVSVIKNIRALTGLGLKEAKDASEATKPVTLPLIAVDVNGHISSYGNLYTQEELMRAIRAEGGQIGPTVFKIINELRDLGAQALKLGEDELANEILQLVLAEKLRRGNG